MAVQNSVTDKTPTLLAQITSQKDGATPAPRVLTPKIKVKPDQFGVMVRARTLPQVGLEEYQKSARFLAGAWRCTRVSVLPDGPGKVSPAPPSRPVLPGRVPGVRGPGSSGRAVTGIGSPDSAACTRARYPARTQVAGRRNGAAGGTVRGRVSAGRVRFRRQD